MLASPTAAPLRVLGVTHLLVRARDPALFDALPDAGVSCLRFNFRGVGGSEGGYGDGIGERLDAQAALDHLLATVPHDVPVLDAAEHAALETATTIEA